MIYLRAGSATDVGLVRQSNEDRLLVATPLFAVADGMGGAAAGEVASGTAVQSLLDAFNAGKAASAETLLGAARSANRAVWEQAEANPAMRGMGTTLVAIALVGGDRIAAVNIGDSRLYLLRGDEFRQVTSDHNLVAELVAEGRISKEEAEVHPRRNIMTRALGVDPEVDVDLFVEDPEPGDRYLLCSDGLSRELRDESIVSILRRFGDPEEAAKELVDEAKRRGGNDNITVVVVDVADEAAAAVPASNGTDEPPVPPAAVAPEVVPPTDAGSPIVTPAQPDERDAASTSPDASAESSPPAAAAKPKAKMITVRVVGFFALVVIVLALAAAAIAWYARSSYYVGLRGDAVTIFQGRPGGVLWFRPTIASRTSVTVSDVLSHEIPKLRAGQEEASLAEARQYVTSLVAEANAARAAASPSTTVPAGPTSTGPPPTT